jgi:hypothetical protein
MIAPCKPEALRLPQAAAAASPGDDRRQQERRPTLIPAPAGPPDSRTVRVTQHADGTISHGHEAVRWFE